MYLDCDEDVEKKIENERKTFHTWALSTLGFRLSYLLSFQKLLKEEMGGNNPLVIWDIKGFKPAIYITLVFAYLSFCQRCSCPRRLIIKKGSLAQAFIPQLVEAIKNLRVGLYSDTPEPFMGPLVSLEASQRILDAERYLLSIRANSFIPLLVEKSCLVHPGLINVTDIPLELRIDVEYFGPLLQLSLVDNFQGDLNEAKSTCYDFLDSLLTDNKSLFYDFYTPIKAGLIHLNAPTTGAKSHAPFGGIGISCNLIPSSYYAADFCAYPVVFFENDKLNIPIKLLPGINL